MVYNGYISKMMKRSLPHVKEYLNYELCIICQEISAETVQKLTKQGYPALLSAATAKFDNISNLLKTEIVNEEDFLSRNPVYHARCRRTYTIQHYKSDEYATNVGKKVKLNTVPSRDTTLVNKDSCFICQKDRDAKGNRKLILISTLSRQNEIWRKAKELDDIDMLIKIEGFGDSCIDMVANDFKYHYICITNYLNKKVKKKIASPKSTHFYPLNELQSILFGQGKGVSFSWIRTKIHEKAAVANIFYDSKYPRSADIEAVLKTEFGMKVVILPNEVGLSSVVFSVQSIIAKMKKYIVDETADSDTGETTDIENQILEMPTSSHTTQANIFHTASVIRRDIMNTKRQTSKMIDHTLTIARDESTKLIPPKLFNFIHFLLHRDEVKFDNEERAIISKESEKNEVLSLCQDILFLSGIKTPKSVGLALLLLKQRQKFLIEKLNQLGHCVSYSDAQRYLHDVAVRVDESVGKCGVFIPSNIKRNEFTQFALDNLDFQEKSKDGRTTHGTTHIIYQHSTEGTCSNKMFLKHIHQRFESRKLFLSETCLSKVDKERSRSLAGVSLACSNENKNYVIGSAWNLYSMVSNYLDRDDSNSLSWSSFFERLATNEKSRTIIGYGPFVPESPTNPSVIENSLLYFMKTANLLNQQHVIVTADQAIYEIILALKSKYPVKYETIIPRMGGFHIILNFLGAIGRLMSCSGLEELLVSGRILLEGTAKKVVSGGKDYYQMVRCHTLIHSAIFDLYWEAFEAYVRCKDVSLETKDIENFNTLMDSIKYLQNNFNLNGNREEAFMSFSCSASLITEIEPLKEQFERSLTDNPTSKLWLMYIDMVSIAQWYIYSERSGNWEEHLASVEKMLPYLVAAGHYKYVSYIPHYLKCMRELQSTAPFIWKEFQSGKFTIHLKNGTFNGIWTDMALEQTYNKDCKTQLFSGVCMHPETTDKYIYALPVLTSLTEEFLKMFDISHTKRSSHHNDSVSFTLNELQARECVKQIIRQKINPFAFDTHDLLNIYSGHKCNSTELSNAKRIGLDVLEMAEKNNYQKIPAVKIKLFSDTLKTTTSAEIKSKLYEDEAMVLRSMYFARDLDENKKLEVFSHEWLSYPPSLSEPSFSGYTLRKGNKADFFHSIKSQMKDTWIEVRELNCAIDKKAAYIIDMMAFIQRRQYKNCKTFCELYEKYMDAILSNKPLSCDLIVLVGDRYEDNIHSVKEMERMKRKKSGVTSQEFEVQDNIEIPNWQTFLSNNSNKARLLKYISNKLCKEHSRLPNNLIIITAGMAENTGTTTTSSTETSKVIPDLHFSHHNEADTRIFAIIQYLSNMKYNCIIIEATDTDIFVLSLYFIWRLTNIHELWFRRFDVFIPIHHTMRELTTEKTMNAQMHLGDLFLCTYALTGCDTVSFLFKKGKSNVVKKCLTHAGDKELQALLDYPQNDINDLIPFLNSARYFVKILYGRPSFTGDLNKLRAHLFHTCKSDIRNLPPTEDSFYQHILRAAYQIIIWKGATTINPEIPNPINFGWNLKDNVLIPSLITISVRPNVTYENVFCKCKFRKCSGNCSCNKAGLKCIIGCYCEGQCISF